MSARVVGQRLSMFQNREDLPVNTMIMREAAIGNMITVQARQKALGSESIIMIRFMKLYRHIMSARTVDAVIEAEQR